jgi:hypothetical protein
MSNSTCFASNAFQALHVAAAAAAATTTTTTTTTAAAKDSR